MHANSAEGLTQRTGRSSATVQPASVTDQVRDAARSYAETQLERQQMNRTARRVIYAVTVALAALVGRSFSLLDILSNPAMMRSWSFKLAVVSLIALLGIYAELRWLRRWREQDPRPVNFANWQEQFPRTIQLATLTGAVTATAWIVAFWPYWSGWTIPVLSILAIGAGSAADLILI